jgi:tetratricopeptide (TPR) repeat protein
MSRVRAARPVGRILPGLVAGLAMLGAFAAPGAQAKTAEELIAEGDQHYAAAKLVDARVAYFEAVQQNPGHYAALCRLSRSESELGELQKGDEQRGTRAAAIEHARAAIKAAPDSAAGHVWLAVALGRQALGEGPKTKLALSREIKSEVDRAIQLDPNIGRAWHVLAMWNAKLSSLNTLEKMTASAVLGGVPKGASWENAEKAFQKAIALEPGYLNHHLEFGRMLKDRGRKAEAKQELEKAATLPPTSSALDSRYQAEAKELLARLK